MNLLQPQDRRSLDAGDSTQLVAARKRLLHHAIGLALQDSIAAMPDRVSIPAGGVVVDLGSGTGDALAALADPRGITGVGIDLSVAAASLAARSFPRLTWVVANADRKIPLLDHSASLILSLNARRNPAECSRVLQDGGWLVVAVPSADDLIELRTAVQGAGVHRARAETVVREHEAGFESVDRWSVREVRTVDEGSLQDLLHTTYRGARRASAGRVDKLAEMPVTLSSDVVLFRRR